MDETTATMRAEAALHQAVYFLDRELAPGAKVRAFSGALATVRELTDDELATRAREATLTDLDGIGKSTAAVISAAVLEQPNTYLAKLDERSAITIDEGAALRAALRGDCHAHSSWSDGGASVRQMALAARALGHDYLVMTDHSARLTVAHGLSEERLAQQLDEIERLNAEFDDFRILTGMEVDILVDGSLDLADNMLARLDLVVASVHSKLRMPSDEMTKRMVLAVASPHVDVLGHCTNRKVTGTGRAPSEFDADMVFAACEKFGTAVEINCRPERQDPPDDLLDLALEWGCLLAIDTDAHAPGQLEWQAYGCDKAARHDVEADRIINSWTADDLVEWTSTKGAA